MSKVDKFNRFKHIVKIIAVEMGLGEVNIAIDIDPIKQEAWHKN